MREAPQLWPQLSIEGESIPWSSSAGAKWHYIVFSAMLTTTPHCVVTSVVGKLVLKAIPAFVNVGNPVETANGQLHKYYYRVDIPKVTSLGTLD